MNVKPIVAATDGSEESLRAVEWAASEAILHAAPLRALIGLSARTDLVVMGRRGEHRGPHGPGPVRHAVLSHAHGPIAMVPAGR
jgi:Universal stress protein family